ncbi:hypothetical protein BJ138DRAFT_852335 [Hygrophoropsis aurantiaca]|uniref:Uncharacterized protein n=1 Tax=Hygrophoropsis aurantiaca TaxID=72124 RepID=A0ACB7ZW57_9AGAM|nr:hypothetical protein BJ138DRAFT_852335 [Hygrophoropsis aurantiaca]
MENMHAFHTEIATPWGPFASKKSSKDHGPHQVIGFLPQTLPSPAWSAHIQPEGQKYFYHHKESGFSAVTDANIYDSAVALQISDCMKHVRDVISQSQLVIPETAELYLEYCEYSHVCRYYFVDHMAKTQFWLEPMSTEMLNLPEVVSDSHLKLALERLYWVHVESFPMHLGNRISPQVVTELIGVMSHGQAGEFSLSLSCLNSTRRKSNVDRMTSSASTFPYTAEKCKEFLCLLNPRQGQPLDGYTLCFVARLWGAIVNSRFATYYGEEHAQLDRLQRMLPSDDADCPWISLVAHHTCWGMPNLFKSQLQDIFVDDRVFVDQWASFMSRCVDDWSQSLRWVSAEARSLSDMNSDPILSLLRPSQR